MMERRNLLGGLLALPFVKLASVFKRDEALPSWMTQKVHMTGVFGGATHVLRHQSQCQWHGGLGRSIVEVMRHVGGNSDYVTKWTFPTEDQAVAFVRSLIPKLTKVTVFNKTSEVNVECCIVSRDKPDEIVAHGWEVGEVWYEGERVSYLKPRRDIIPFWTISNAWTYLATMRVDGKGVSRPSESGALSEYLIEPFIKGDPMIRYSNRDRLCSHCCETLGRA